MVEKRKLSVDNLRQLCIKNTWYTKGTVKDYNSLVDFVDITDNLDSKDIVYIAENILINSGIEYTSDTLSTICFEIAEICHSFFREEY